MNRPLTPGPANRSDKADIGYEPDGYWRDGNHHVLVELKSGTHSFRNVRASLLGLAYRLAREPEDRALLVLTDSRITEERLHAELQLAGQTLKPDVMRRLSLVLATPEGYVGLPAELGSNFYDWLDDLVANEASKGSKPRMSSDEVFKVMLYQWLLGKGAVTADWITKTVGCSYPTAARALERIGHALVRHRDRRSVLRGFPSEQWKRLVTMSDETRETVHFVDASGQARSSQSLLHRLAALGDDRLAVGGIEGARHYYPGVDLVGLPRLDLTLHSPDGHVDLGFIERLDPGLVKADQRDAPAAMALHVLRRKVTLFDPGENGLQWADPVECLLDLHEARLEPQAKEFLNFLIKNRSGTA